MLYVSFMRDLEMLSVASSFTDDGLSQFGRLTKLKELSLAGSQVTDHGMTMLKAFPMLTRLDIGDTAVTDAGLKAIRGLPLVSLRLGAGIHDGGLMKMRFPETRWYSLISRKPKSPTRGWRRLRP